MNDIITVYQVFNNPIHEVWAALTVPDEMRNWFFNGIPDFKPEVDFQTKFLVQSGGNDFMHLWHIEKVVPGRFISYNWKYEGFEGNSRVEFSLTEVEGRTKLELRHIVLEPFTANLPEFESESCLEGWTYFIKEMLNKHLSEK